MKMMIHEAIALYIESLVAPGETVAAHTNG
jgi:hypothetical protein